MNILITGGAGYIGSHVLKALLERGADNISVVDNFYSGSRETLATLESVGKFDFYKCDLSDTQTLREIFGAKKFDAIIHFAAFIEVFESMQKPLKYYLNNTANAANLVALALEFGVGRFIFSSTAAVYGEPSSGVVNENSPLSPINPYGRSKLMTEWILKDAAGANANFKYGILRYFNVAGAASDALIGQRYPNATHLIKVATETIVGKREKMSIFGCDYDTADGSCVRDFIHIEDLASAHLAALEYLDERDSDIFNVGYGRGFSVKEVIEVAKKVSGVNFKVEEGARRAGDPATLIADASKLRNLTSWRPKNDSLELIISSALAWEKKIL